jgi:2-polyprenyl-3-methyl-5-hydroxy-6-metoxy-1,4-benzoquinol methylase
MTEKAFAFGKNWKAFSDKYLNPERIAEAEKSLREFLNFDTLAGKTFVDVGCGSGLFSLAAHRLGAAKVVSFDVDADSTECCRRLRESAGSPDNWQVLNGSVLDADFVAGLGKFDIVYSWGVLHHTGRMWQAIESASKLAGDNGSMYIAIYNRADGFAIYPDGRMGPSSLWVAEKKIYSSLPPIIQNAIDYVLMAVMVLMYLLSFSNPVRKIRAHKALRGMSWRIDIKDWLGGYPYEYASVEEVFRFVCGLGFSLENLKSNNGLLNNEYLFKRK